MVAGEVEKNTALEDLLQHQIGGEAGRRVSQ